MKMYANLHTHSTHSDGKYTPEELVRIAHEEGYKALAVTDHDTVTANAEVAALCREYGMENIFGAEFSTPERYHIVGLDFDPEYPEMKEYLRQMAVRETDQTKVLFEKGLERGSISGITWDEVLEYNRGIAWLCNEHVFRAMKAKGLVTDLDYNEFFDVNYGKLRRTVPPAYPFKSVGEIIPLIKKAGGIAIVAHPNMEQLAKMDELIAAGIDGTEVFHPDLTAEEQAKALELAYQHGLFIAGGTDHSGLCGGMYDTFEHPEETPYWVEPQACGTSEQHFRELQARSIEKRTPFVDYSSK
jgi:predicted metal-dependent phosphoesterase TrpH